MLVYYDEVLFAIRGGSSCTFIGDFLHVVAFLCSCMSVSFMVHFSTGLFFLLFDYLALRFI